MAQTAKRIAPTLRDNTPRTIQGVADALNTRLQAVERIANDLQTQLRALQERVRKLETTP